MTNEIKVGDTIAWLMYGKRGRAVMGTVVGIAFGVLTVEVTSSERKMDAKLIGTRLAVWESVAQVVQPA